MTEAQHQIALTRARRGDGRALAALLDRYRPYIRLLLRGIDRRQDAENLVHDAVSAAKQTFGQFQGTTLVEFLTWLRSSVQGTPLPTLRLQPRKRKRSSRPGLAEETGIEEAIATTFPQEQVARVARRLARVPDDLQQLLLNLHMDGLSLAALATRSGRSEAELQVAYVSALRRLHAESRHATSVDANSLADEALAPLLLEALAELRARDRLDLASWRRRQPELLGLLGTMHALDAALADCLPAGGRAALSVAASPAPHDTWATLDGSARAADFPPQEQIGRYILLQELGAGGMGVVHKAHDPQLQRTVAIKVPRFEETGRMSEVSRLRFLREARAAAAIRHAHVCPIYDVGEQDGTPYVVMAFVEGQSLAARLSDGGRYSDQRQAVRLAREIAEALSAVHAHGIIHRDLKPGNILLDGAGHAILTDFGLSHFESDTHHLTAEGMLLGTPAYMAPEQARCDKVDARSDLFSLGSVLYQICTGELPFKGKNVTALLAALELDAPTPLAETNPDLPPKLAALLMQLLAKNPARRPRSAQEVVERLQAIERDQSVRPASTNAIRGRPRDEITQCLSGESLPPSRPRAPWKRRSMGLVAGLFAAAVASIASVWLCGAPSAQSTTEGKNRETQTTAGKQLPLKIVLLAGQSNMGGQAAISTLDRLGKEPETAWLLAKIKEAAGEWKVRENVWITYQRESDLKQGPLTVGYGESDREIGPELLLGHVLGDAVENPILLVKVVQGPMSLGVEGRPPSAGGVTGRFYKRMIETIRRVQADPAAFYPHYEGQGCEVAGFVWFQGWNDHLKAELVAQYETNLVHLIGDIRRDLGVSNLPVVIGEMGIQGKKPKPEVLAMRRAQSRAVDRPIFAGSVVLVRTAGYSDEQARVFLSKGFDESKNKWFDEAAKQQFETMGSKPEYLYLGSGKTFALIGNSFGEALKDLWQRQPSLARP